MLTTTENPTKQKRVKKVDPVCQICDEKLNKSNHIPIQCQYCMFESCRTCCETYATNESTIKCMNTVCGREWTRKFIRDVFTLVFINGPLKQHREQLLFDRERALLPATQPIIEGKIACEKIDKQINEIRKEVTKLYTQINNLTTDRSAIAHNPRRNTERAAFVRACPDEDCRGFLSSQWKCGICEKWCCPDCHAIKGYMRDVEHVCNPDDLATAQLLANDTKPCPKCRTGIFKIDGCFSENTPILLFDGSIKMSQFISVGDVLVGYNGTERQVSYITRGIDRLFKINQSNGISYTVNSKHILVLKNGLVTHKMTVTDYLKLPNDERSKYKGFKKKKNIYKGGHINNDGLCIDFETSDITITEKGKGQYYGWSLETDSIFILPDNTVVHNCDQMWCTQCHTAFSWRTGAIQNNVHNPHYYEWMRRNNGGDAPRNEGDVPCGRELTHQLYERIARCIRTRHNQSPIAKQCMRNCDEIIRRTIHLNLMERPIPANYERRNEELRVRYLMKEITEPDMKEQLQRDEKRHNKIQELSDIYTMVFNTISDIMFRFSHYLEVDSEPNHFSEDILNEIDPLIKYTNECLADVSHTYSCTKYVLGPRVLLYTGTRAIRYLNEQNEQQVNV